MRLLYFGDPAGAIELLDRELNLVGMVHGRRGGRGLKTLLPKIRHLPRWHLPDLTDPQIISSLNALRPDLLVSCFYPQLIPKSILSLAPGVNVHPSALPRWRGPDPCAWAIRAGDERTAITVHWLTDKLDEGDIIEQTPHDILPTDTTGRLATRLEALGAIQIADVVHRMARGQTPPSRPQTGDVTWAPLDKADDWEIDWHKSATEIERFVRAAMPDPGAYSGIGQELLVVYRSRKTEAGQFDFLPPGTPFVRDGFVHIKCGMDALQLRRVKLGRRTLSGPDFARLFV
ncbi:MAG: methionyl-tRNA formyltransferase [Myxococcota bacterium]|nr:methionyl-tRNA formyltransferase [Myxococcota bacterium]